MADTLAPIVSVFSSASLELASARDLAGHQAQPVEDIIGQLDRAIDDLAAM